MTIPKDVQAQGHYYKWSANFEKIWCVECSAQQGMTVETCFFDEEDYS